MNNSEYHNCVWATAIWGQLGPGKTAECSD